MGREIDERIVQMRFDNKQFEDGVSTTISTLGRLKQSLNFKDVENNFNAITKASAKVDMSGIGNAIDNVKSRFSAFEVMAITAISNVTNSFVNSAKRMINEFTLEPITSGFQEYETQINAIQTILANTQKEGTNIKDVNAALDELNLYADKTIYNFTEMTRNIGTFTAAGVDLKTSVSAIQGIANLAAVSGSTSQQAATAMYQLSQALAAGTVKLQDWNSVVNAGMGGEVFQNALKETARIHGVAIDKMIEDEGSFRETLKNGWITSELLTETLKKFTTTGANEYLAENSKLSLSTIQNMRKQADASSDVNEAYRQMAKSIAETASISEDQIFDILSMSTTAEDAATKVKTFTQLIDTLKEAVQSGWSQSFRILIGDFEEAKELFSEISDSFSEVINKSSDIRNKLLKDVFVKKEMHEYITDLTNISTESVEQLQSIGKEAGYSSDAYKQAVLTIVGGNADMASTVQELMNFAESGQDVTYRIKSMTGASFESIKALQDLGKKSGYTSDEFQEMALRMANGNKTMAVTIACLLEMSEAMTRPTGRELLIDALRNSLKGLLSVIQPVKEAFEEVFPSITEKQLYGLIENFKNLSEKLMLTDEQARNIKDAFTGFFNIVKLLIGTIGKFARLLLPVLKPIGSLVNLLLKLSGYVGRSLTAFTEWIEQSSKIAKAYNKVSAVIDSAMGSLATFIDGIYDFMKSVKNLPIIQTTITKIVSIFRILGEGIAIAFYRGSQYAVRFRDSLLNVLPKSIEGAFAGFVKVINALQEALMSLSVEGPISAIGKIQNAFKSLLDTLMKNKGIAAFVRNAAEFGRAITNAFKFDRLIENITKAKNAMQNFMDWVKKYIGPFFEGITLSSVIAGGTGVAIVATFLKFANAFEKLIDIGGSIPDILDSIGDAVKAYENNLNATAIIKVAGAIAILAGAIVLLSFADPGRAVVAAMGLSALSIILLAAMNTFLRVTNESKKVTDALYIFAKGLQKSLNKLASAVKFAALGKMMKDFAKSITLIAASIIAVGLLYQKNPYAIEQGAKIIGVIGAAITAMILVMSRTKQDMMKGLGNFAGLTASILSLAISMTTIVAAVKKLMNIDLPHDWRDKMKIFTILIAEMGALILAMNLGASISKGNKNVVNGLIGVSLLLITMVESLKGLFKIEIPDDWGLRFGILTGIFAALAALLITIGYASKLAGGVLKGAGVILSMSVFLATLTASLLILSLLSTEDILKGAIGIGSVLLTLAVSLSQVAEIENEEVYKVVQGMALTIGVITAAIAILGRMNFKDMLAGAVALGSILLAIAVNFKAVSEIEDENAWTNILAMCGTILVIAVSLDQIASHDWKSILAAGVALSASLLAISGALKIASGIEFDKSALGGVAVGIGILLAITASLVGLAVLIKDMNIVETLLGLGGAIVSVGFIMRTCMIVGKQGAAAITGALQLELFLLSFAGLMVIVSKLIKQETLEGGIEIYNKIFSTLKETIIQIGLVMAVCTLVGMQGTAALVGIGSLMTFLGSFTVLLTILGAIFKGDARELITNGISVLLEAFSGLNKILLTLGVVMTACTAIGMFGPAAVKGVGAVITFLGSFTALLGIIGLIFKSEEAQYVLASGGKVLIAIGEAIGGFVGAIISGFVGQSMKGLEKIGTSLSNFAKNATPFFTRIKIIDKESVDAVFRLAELMLVLTASSVIQGLTGWFTSNLKLEDFGKELVAFAPSIVEFSEKVKGIKTEAVEGAANAALAMAKMAKAIPNEGGVLADLLGDNTLQRFGEELASFGPNIAKFAEIVKDVKPEAVEGAANAAEMLADMNHKLPNTGGFAAKVFGDNTLSQFGYELSKFGPYISLFAERVKNIDISGVEGAANAGKIMAGLTQEIPNSGGLLGWIVGNNDLDKFGTQLYSFGTSLLSYSNTVKDVDYTVVDNSIESFRSLLTLFNDIQAEGKINISNFSSAIKKLASISIQNFIDSFNNSYTEVINCINSFLLVAVTEISKGQEKFKIEATGLCNAFLNEIKINVPKFTTAGGNLINGLITGMKLKRQEVIDTAKEIAEAVNNIINEVWDEHSPSKVAVEDAENYDKGLGMGFENGKKMVVNKAKDVAKEATEGVSDELKEGLDKVTEVGEEKQKEFWTKMLKIKQEGIDKAKYKDMDYKSFSESIVKDTIDIWNKYTDELKKNTESTMSQISLFDQVSKKDGVSKDTLIQNLKDQIEAYADFNNIIVSLNSRVQDENILSIINKMSISNVEELRAMNSMTDDELSQYTQLFQTKFAYAQNIANEQMVETRKTTTKELSDLFGGVQVDLIEFGKTFDGTLKSITSYIYETVDATKDMDSIGANIINGIGKTVTKSAVKKNLKGLKEGVKETAEEAKESMLDSLLPDYVKDSKYYQMYKKYGSDTLKSTVDGFVNGATEWGIGKIGDVSKLIGIDGVENPLKEVLKINSPSKVTEDIGSNVVEGLVKGMNDNSEVVRKTGVDTGEKLIEGLTEGVSSIQEVINALISVIDANDGKFMETGMDTAVQYIGGIRNQFDLTKKTIEEYVKLIIDTVDESKEEFFKCGTRIVEEIIFGMKDMELLLVETCENLGDKIVQTFEALSDRIKQAGEDAVNGYVAGLESGYAKVSEIMAKFADLTIEGIMTGLDAHSPSKKTFKVGTYAAIGFLNGLMSYASEANKAGEFLVEGTVKKANEALKELSRVITDADDDWNPVIRPTVDLENVNKSISDINRLFNSAININTIQADGIVAIKADKARASEIQNQDKNLREEKTGNTYQFIQNNTSPKALSPIDIYRQTKNQFSQFRQVVEG